MLYVANDWALSLGHHLAPNLNIFENNNKYIVENKYTFGNVTCCLELVVSFKIWA